MRDVEVLQGIVSSSDIETREMQIRAISHTHLGRQFARYTWEIQQFINGEWKKIEVIEELHPCTRWKKRWLSVKCGNCGRPKGEHDNAPV